MIILRDRFFSDYGYGYDPYLLEKIYVDMVGGSGNAMTYQELLQHSKNEFGQGNIRNTRGGTKILKNSGKGMTNAQALRVAIEDNNRRLANEQASKELRRQISKQYGKEFQNYMKATKGQGTLEGFLEIQQGKKGAAQTLKVLDKNIDAKAGKILETHKANTGPRGTTFARDVTKPLDGVVKNAEAKSKEGFFQRLKNGWNGMSTRNKVLVGGGAAALAAGGAYLAHKRRAKARASREDD